MTDDGRAGIPPGSDVHDCLLKELRQQGIEPGARRARGLVPQVPSAGPAAELPASKRRKPSRIRHSPRKAKTDKVYSSAEVLVLYDITRNTLSNWIENGLRVVPGNPKLFQGKDLNAFHRRRRDEACRPCRPDELYCLACKRISSLVGRNAEFRPENGPRAGTLRWVCHCGKQNETFYSQRQCATLASLGVKLSVAHADYNASLFAAQIVQIDPNPEPSP